MLFGSTWLKNNNNRFNYKRELQNQNRQSLFTLISLHSQLVVFVRCVCFSDTGPCCDSMLWLSHTNVFTPPSLFKQMNLKYFSKFIKRNILSNVVINFLMINFKIKDKCFNTYLLNHFIYFHMYLCCLI